MSAPGAPNANCTYCGVPILWAKKSPADLERAAAEGALVTEFHRPLDATQVSAGYTIIEGCAYYVYVHPIHVCQMANALDRQQFDTNQTVMQALSNLEGLDKAKTLNELRYGRVQTLSQRRSALTNELEWTYALVRPCSSCQVGVGEKCESLNKGKRAGETLVHPHKIRLTRAELHMISMKVAELE